MILVPFSNIPYGDRLAKNVNDLVISETTFNISKEQGFESIQMLAYRRKRSHAKFCGSFIRYTRFVGSSDFVEWTSLKDKFPRNIFSTGLA